MPPGMEECHKGPPAANPNGGLFRGRWPRTYGSDRCGGYESRVEPAAASKCDCFVGFYVPIPEGGPAKGVDGKTTAVAGDTLAAMREMAAQNPLEGRLGALYCRYCGARQERIVEKDRHGFRIRTVRMTHTDGCPWLRSQEGASVNSRRAASGIAPVEEGDGCHGQHAGPVAEGGGE